MAEAEMRIIGKEDLLAIDDRRYKNIFVPEWGGYIRIRSLTAGEGLEVVKVLQNDKGNVGMIIVFVRSAVDSDNALLFTGSEEAAIEQLKVKSLSGFSLIQDEVLKLNRLGQYGAQEVEIAKND